MLLSTLERRQEEKERRRNDIIDAAEIVFAEKGVDKATMADVAAKARLSRGLLYFYFKDKEDLHLAIMHRASLALYNAFQAVLTADMTGLEKAGKLGETYVRFSTEHANYFEAMSNFESRVLDYANPNSTEQACIEVGCQTLELIAEVIKQGMEDGSIDKNLGDPMRVGINLWGFTHGMIQLTQTKEIMLKHMCNAGPEELVAMALEMMKKSLS